MGMTDDQRKLIARYVRCDWHPEHGSDVRPTGPRCGDPATKLDGGT